MDFKEFLNEQRRRTPQIAVKNPTEEIPAIIPPTEEEDPNKVGKRKAKKSVSSAVAAMHASTDIKLSLYDRFSKVLSERYDDKGRRVGPERSGQTININPRNLPAVVRPTRPAQKQLPGGTSVTHPRGSAQGTRTPEYTVKRGPRDLGTVPAAPSPPPQVGGTTPRWAQFGRDYMAMQKRNLPTSVKSLFQLGVGGVELPFRYTNALRSPGVGYNKKTNPFPTLGHSPPGVPQRPTDWPGGDDGGGGGGQPGQRGRPGQSNYPPQIGTRGALVRRRGGGASVVTRR